MKRHTKTLFNNTGSYVALILISFVVMLPFMLALSFSFQTPESAASFPPRLFPRQVYFGNFVSVMKLVNIPRMMLNSFLVAVMISFGKLFTGVLSGYAFGNFLFKGNKLLFMLLFVTLFLPAESVMIVPLFMIVDKLGWINTYWGLAVPFMASATNTFVMRQHFLTMPRELEEASRIDGCGPMKYLWLILLPLSLPMIASMTMVNFVGAWNMYLWPLITTMDNSMRTIPIGVKMLMDTEANTWGETMAGTVIAMLPPLILFFSLQNLFVKSLARSGLKG